MTDLKPVRIRTMISLHKTTTKSAVVEVLTATLKTEDINNTISQSGWLKERVQSYGTHNIAVNRENCWEILLAQLINCD